MSDAVRADFDRLASLPAWRWDHNRHYHGYLLRHVPSPCARALDVGCGTGAFSRLLAGWAGQVVGLDLSLGMIQVARARAGQHPNLRFQVADVNRWPFPREAYDCIASIATLHHLPLAETLARMRDALRPGGALLILDLYQAQGVGDRLAGLAAMPVSLLLNLLKNGRLRAPRAVRQAWAAHGLHDTYAPLSQVREVCAGLLPGAKIKRHLLWRYSLVWKRGV
ncbi:MAG: class I SAM-dependent methyltransferase [Anaerolineae bacterium]|jgi:SAM-dependent methyltransferase